MSDLDNIAAGAGIALGAGVGSTTSILATGDVAQGAAYGVAVGIIVGTSLARLAPRATDTDRPGLALVATGLFLGLAVGGVVGTVAAWSVDTALVAGAQVGGAGGAVLGLLLAGILAATTDSESVGDDTEPASQ